ncbi:hypothetical protein [Flammeovirga aprica]|uniref:Uncharacterized protein n=1 Tax=Flammeovirga aprica JL-4 TaxID=694437 RepID=A0A7X9S0M9_9BACT|nr:hypothetical protein [Flammeovirga aprica]NME72272.1 hypothetical protein [Flammeovirga aprica JL-4]
MSIIVIQAIASAISIPTEMDNINIHLHDGEVVSITKKEWKRGKRFSDESTLVYMRDKKLYVIEKENIESIRYESVKTHNKTVDFMEEYAKIQPLKEEAKQYYHTKKHKQGRFSQVLGVGAVCVGATVAPLILVVSPIPLVQAVSRLKKVDFQYCLKGNEWKELKQYHKEQIKYFKEKATI